MRAIAGLGLKEAKDLVEVSIRTTCTLIHEAMPGTVSHHSYSLQHCQSAPKVVMKDLKKEKAEEWKAQLEAIGAKIEIE